MRKYSQPFKLKTEGLRLIREVDKHGKNSLAIKSKEPNMTWHLDASTDRHWACEYICGHGDGAVLDVINEPHLFTFGEYRKTVSFPNRCDCWEAPIEQVLEYIIARCQVYIDFMNSVVYMEEIGFDEPLPGMSMEKFRKLKRNKNANEITNC